MQLGSNHDPLMSEINVTPFVDVMLVLLIIFMVTAPMMIQGVDVNLPKTSSGPLKAEEEHLIITVKRDGAVFISDQAVEVTTLTRKLQSILAGQERREVFLRADKDVPYGSVVHVMTLIKNAGVESLGMITLPRENGEQASK